MGNFVNTQEVSITRASGASHATFHPSPLNINVGDDVFWTNNDTERHNLAPAGQPADTWLDFPIPGKQHGQNPSSSSAVTFGTAGTYQYVCTLHANETGEIVAS
ncbi:MAG: hypothetical protein JO152_12440 [Mycobacteriaceae bacterium]|nr:hypothetical protein [Mycobacteriaceae bacterium]